MGFPFGHLLPTVLAVCARGLFSRCPRLVQSMPVRRSVREHVVDTEKPWVAGFFIIYS